MTCEHEWRNWPYSEDKLCLRCNYQVIKGVHYPLGNPKWMRPQPETAEITHDGIRYVVPEAVVEFLRNALASKSSSS